jgi:hypothetical protein
VLEQEVHPRHIRLKDASRSVDPNGVGDRSSSIGKEGKMKRTLAIITLAAAAWTAAASADGGGPTPGLDYGTGVALPGAAVRFVAMPAGTGTLVEAIRVHGGQVLRARYLRGSYGVPTVTYGGDTGGLARNGRRLVLASNPVGPITHFLVVDPRTLKVRKRLVLRGRFAFDALSPGGSLMYLLQYLGQPTASGQRYAVRALDLNTARLYPGPIVDRREPDEKMNGIALTRVESDDGSWAYTLYSRTDNVPFVHALDTNHRRAFCVDVPWHGSTNALWRMRMQLNQNRLELRLGPTTVAYINTKTFEANRL